MSVVCLLTNLDPPSPSVSVVIAVISKAKVTFHTVCTLIVNMLQNPFLSKVASFLPSSVITIHLFFGYRFVSPASQFCAAAMLLLLPEI